MTPFLLGAAAVAAVVAAAALALGIVVDANGWDDVRLSLGPVALVMFERAAAGTSTTFGLGLPLVAVLGGLANAGAAAVLRCRMRSSRRGGAPLR